MLPRRASDFVLLDVFLLTNYIPSLFFDLFARHRVVVASFSGIVWCLLLRSALGLSVSKNPILFSSLDMLLDLDVCTVLGAKMVWIVIMK